MGCPWVLGLSGPRLHRPPTKPQHSCLTLVADEPGPACRAVAAVQAREAGPSIPAVSTGQAAVWAEGVIQADWGQMGDGPQIPLAQGHRHRLWSLGPRRGYQGRPLPMKDPNGEAGDGSQMPGPGRAPAGEPGTRSSPGSDPDTLCKLHKRLDTQPRSEEAIAGILPQAPNLRVARGDAGCLPGSSSLGWHCLSPNFSASMCSPRASASSSSAPM